MIRGHANVRWWSTGWAVCLTGASLTVCLATDDRSGAFLAGSLVVTATRMIDGAFDDWRAYLKHRRGQP